MGNIFSRYPPKNTWIAEGDVQPVVTAAAARASASAPQVVMVAPGLYIGDINWALNDYVSLIGFDKYACIIRGVGGLTNKATIEGVGSYCRIANLTIQAANVANSKGIMVGDSSGVTVEDVIIEDCILSGAGSSGNIDNVYAHAADTVNDLQLRRIVGVSAYDGFALGACKTAGSPAIIEDCTLKATSAANGQALHAVTLNSADAYLRICRCDLSVSGSGQYTTGALVSVAALSVEGCTAPLAVSDSRLYAAITNAANTSSIAVLKIFDDDLSPGPVLNVRGCSFEGNGDFAGSGTWYPLYLNDDTSGGVYLHGCVGALTNALGEKSWAAGTAGDPHTHA